MGNVIFYKGKKFTSGNTEYKVEQIGGVDTNANYEILLSGSADDTTHIEGTKKTSTLHYNPYTKSLLVKNGSLTVGSFDIADYGGITINKTDIVLSNGWIDNITSLKDAISGLSGKVSKSGDTMTGNLLVSRGATDGASVSVYNGTYDCGIHIGTGGVNHGLYDFTPSINKWLIYNDGTNTIVDGKATENVLKTGDTMTGMLLLKQSGIDGSKTDNNVSSPQYPTTFCVLDTASRILVRQEGVIESSGNISSYSYVRNYNTSGTQVAQKGLKMTMNKSGTLTWTIDDAANFRTALGLGSMATANTSSYVAKTGDTMSGLLTQSRVSNSYYISKTNTYAITTASNNGITSNTDMGGLLFRDKNDANLGDVHIEMQTNGCVVLSLYAQNKKTNGSNFTNALNIFANKDGSATYTVTSPDNFRSAISAAAASHSHAYLPTSGGTITGNINWNGSSGYSSGLYWKESGYGDQFKIYPQFSGSDDANYLCIATAAGGAGTSPSLTERFKFFPSGKFQMVNGETTGWMSVGSYLNVHGGVELRGSTNYIDFHINKSTSDYTARIIESSSGKLTAYNSISNSSDERLKKDIKELDDKYLHLLDKIDAKQFRYKKGDEYLFAGFIAQEFETGLKEAGITDLPVVTPPTEADDYYGLDYSQVTAILWKICQNQEQRIKELENKMKGE